jgi:hypothetical protein
MFALVKMPDILRARLAGYLSKVLVRLGNKKTNCVTFFATARVATAHRTKSKTLRLLRGRAGGNLAPLMEISELLRWKRVDSQVTSDIDNASSLEKELARYVPPYLG